MQTHAMRGKEDEILAPKAKRNVDQLYAIEAMVNVLASRSNAIGAAANPSHAGPFSEAPSSIWNTPRSVPDVWPPNGVDRNVFGQIHE